MPISLTWFQKYLSIVSSMEMSHHASLDFWQRQNSPRQTLLFSWSMILYLRMSCAAPWAGLCHTNAQIILHIYISLSIYICVWIYILNPQDEIILHHVHFCAVKAHCCFASKTVDLSFAGDIAQSAYNSVLAYQLSNLPLQGMCQPSKGMEEVCWILMASISSDSLS